MLPDGINGSNSHSVGGAGRCVGGGEDQEVAAVHALGFQLKGFNSRDKKGGEGWT